ncbi:MAG TPA: hypothetical protein VEK33_18355 [Terriglobales bacterium]|nr:hypothetical protein [Terriglobales bacterium]
MLKNIRRTVLSNLLNATRRAVANRASTSGAAQISDTEAKLIIYGALVEGKVN